MHPPVKVRHFFCLCTIPRRFRLSRLAEERTMRTKQAAGAVWSFSAPELSVTLSTKDAAITGWSRELGPDWERMWFADEEADWIEFHERKARSNLSAEPACGIIAYVAEPRKSGAMLWIVVIVF